jgi:3-dehydroquinate synthase
MPQGKNLVGAFHQPRLVAIDVNTLTTLPKRDLISGLAECIKHAMIRDAELFAWLEQHVEAIFALDPPTLCELVERNVRIKADVVAADEKEAGVRAHLNFGHTFAHAIEATTGYNVYHHGEAVALGMLAATRYAVEAGRCDAALLDRLHALLARVGLPTRASHLPPSVALVKAMGADKKVADGQIRLILPDRLGAVSIVGASNLQPLIDAFDSLR